MHLIVEITNSCPAKCSFCVVKKERKEKSSIELPMFRRILDLFEPDKITISGGEPSTVNDLEKYVNMAKAYGSVTVVTNCFNPVKVLESNADFIQVSLDAYGKKHDEIRGIDGLWERAVFVLKNAKNSFIRFTLMDSNIDDLRRIKEEFPEKRILVMPEFYSDVSSTVLRIVKEEKLGILPTNCPMGKQIVITAELDILPCPLYRLRLGNLLEDPHRAFERLEKLRPYPCGKRYHVVATTHEK